MTNTEAQQVLGTMLMRYDLTDAELMAIGMAGEALEDEKWISVEEELPEESEEVLICARRTIGMSIPRIRVGYLYSASLNCWRGQNGVDLMEYPTYERVTHWRYLPKGPEVD